MNTSPAVPHSLRVFHVPFHSHHVTERKDEMNDLPCTGTHACLFPESRALTSDPTPCLQGWVPACTPLWADTMPACLSALMRGQPRLERAQLTSRHPEAVGPGWELLRLPALGGGCVQLGG